MLKKIAKKILNILGLLTKIKARNYTELTKYLGIDNGFVYHTHQIDFADGRLIATGDDPQILIEFKKPVSSLEFEYNINHHDDRFEVFYSNMNGGFKEKDKIIIGKCDGTNTIDVAIFKKKSRFCRIDLGQSSGELKISKLKIAQNEIDGNWLDFMLEKISDAHGKKNYVIVTHALNETGAPLLAFNICKTLKKQMANVVVIALADGYLLREYRKLDIPVFCISQEEKDDLERVIDGLKRKGYKNAILNTIVSGETAQFFKGHGFKIISLIHEMKNSIKSFGMEDGGRNANFYSDLIIFPDKIVEKEFYEVFERGQANTMILPQGLYKKVGDIKTDRKALFKKYNIPVDAKIVLGSGMADFRKGIDLFLVGAQQLINNEKNDKYYFVWTGDFVDNSIKNWFHCQLGRNKLEKRFCQIDFIKDKKEYQNLVSSADAFWLTSREDPFPSVMIEALEYCTPVLAFKGCGGADTLLAQGRGILIDDFDVNSLVDETIKLINHPKKVAGMINKAQEYIKKNLIFENYVKTIMKMFDKKLPKKFADLSVIIPNYNYENYLPMRIKSIVEQTLKPREIIFLDDNSKDGSIELAKTLLKKVKNDYGIDYKIIVNNKNQGCFKQWIRGFDEAKSNFVWIAEADDYAAPIFVESLMPKFKGKNTVLAYAKSCVIDGYSRVANYDYNSYLEDLDKEKWGRSFSMDGKKFVTNYLSQKNVIPNASSVIVRKKIALGAKEELGKYQAIGDWLFYIFAASKGKVYYDVRVLNGHRRHQKSIIAKQEKSATFMREMLMIKNYLLTHFSFDDAGLNKLMRSTINENFDEKLIDTDSNLRLHWQRFLNYYQEKLEHDNILIVLPDFEVGGGQTVGIRLANNLSKYYNVFMINAREYLETKMMKEMISDSVTVLVHHDDINYLRLLNKVFSFKAAISMVWWADKLSYGAFSDSGTKRIITMHGCYENLLEHPDIDPYFNEHVTDLITSASHVVYIADKNKKIFKSKNINIKERLSKIDNGFVLDSHPKKSKTDLGINEDDFVFGLVARGIPEKGYEQAIKGINYVNKKMKKKCHLVLVGNGDYIDELRVTHESDYVHFVDGSNGPMECIGWEEIFDVGLLPSYFKSESLPTVIVEMLFLGKPIIATDIGEIKSMLINGENVAGEVIPLKNNRPDQNKLNEAMYNIAKDKKMQKKFQDGARVLSKRFDMKVCIDKYRELIEG